VNPVRGLEYPFALGLLDMPKTEEDVPREHALDEDDVIDPPEGIKRVDLRDRPKDTFDESDDLGVDVV
jgi:hypothetical protein